MVGLIIVTVVRVNALNDGGRGAPETSPSKNHFIAISLPNSFSIHAQTCNIFRCPI